ncbi:MAG: Na/Pi symporter [Cyclobacteriaceae bacterium]
MIQEEGNRNSAPEKWRVYLKNTGYILLALIIFLFALDLMISSLNQLGKTAAETILIATSNPFTALFIGLLATAIIQSSSASTSMIVALVASGAITPESAVPMVMGANVGTTITSTLISLGFIAKRNEFIRAVSAGTYHDFFNILTISILFPFEYYFGFLSNLSHNTAILFFNEASPSSVQVFSGLGTKSSFLVQVLMEYISNGFILITLSLVLLFGSVLFFRKVLTDLLGFGSENNIQKFFFKNRFKSFGWGLITTATIRSSTITTSLVVPLVAKGVVNLRNAAPFILGANIGTTVTAFIAAIFNSNGAMGIAITHFLINFFGVIIFLFIPYLRELPLVLSLGLGKLTRKYRLAGFLYILLIFFVIPFLLIYFYKGLN